MKSLPCRVYPKMESGEYAYLRFEVQNNRKPWTPIERSQSLHHIKKTMKCKTNWELAELIHMSETVVSNSLQLRELQIDHLEMMKEYGLGESYQIEFVRMYPKLKKIKQFQTSEIIIKIFEKVKNRVIRNSKDFRKITKAFLRAKTNEDVIHQFLIDPDMTVAELDEGTDKSRSTFLIEQLMQTASQKKQKGVEFTEQEIKSFQELKSFISKLVKQRV